MNFFKNPFKSKGNVNENLITDKDVNKEEIITNEENLEEGKVEEKEPIEDALAGLSLQEKAEKLATAKEEEKKLVNERIDYYTEANGLREKMEKLGLTDEKKQEIYKQIREEGGEISEKIQELRSKYGLNPSKSEVYSARLEMLSKEVDRIKEDMLYKQRYALDDLKERRTAFLTGDSRIINHTISYLEKEYPGISEVKTVVDKYRSETKTNALDCYDKAINDLAQEISEKSLYKNNADLREAQNRVHKLNKLRGMTESVLMDEREGKE